MHTAVRRVCLLNALSRSLQKYIARPCRQDGQKVVTENGKVTDLFVEGNA
jgi:hypothetical protein